jgi:hypothetical protein
MSKISEQIVGLDYILTGTILKKFGMCGKKTCICREDKKYWHGPYYIWTRKENGKTVTKSLSVAQVKFCRKAIANRKKLDKIIEQWMRESHKEISALGTNNESKLVGNR